MVTDLLYVAVDPRLRTHFAAEAGKRQPLWKEIVGDIRQAVRSVVTIPQRVRRALDENKANRALALREKEERKARAEAAKAARAARGKEKRVLVSKQYSKRSQLGEFWYRYRQNKGAVVALVILLLLALNCIFADVIFDYETQVTGYNLFEIYQKPNAKHWFGTDELGRDLFARVMYGARYSLSIGLATVALAMVVGLPVGAMCGYFGGKIDLYVSRILDIIGSIPGLLMGILVVSALGQSTSSLIIAMAVSRVVGVSRGARAAVLTAKNNEYVEAAKAIGMPTASIIARHVVPNCLSPIIVRTTLQVAGAIVSASSLSYLGLGVPIPSPEWGALLAAGRSVIREYPHLTTFPGLAIMITVLAFNMMGDGLRDALDPKLKK
ncbi:MAG: ABC transporter permease [Ruminococcaceae bacterium]|nr:ABC transporter permease [Oscillospiraceae bacterium]